MRVLFVHMHFPGQFAHLAPALASRSGNEIVALTLARDVPADWCGVRLVTYQIARGNTVGIHPWVRDLESKAVRGEAALAAAMALRDEGFVPDIIIAHPGWGESLFLKNVWPQAKLGIYAEFYFHAEGKDVGFDPEFPVNATAIACDLQFKNINNLVYFPLADAALSPTLWQADTFPAPFRSKITVIHDGVDCDLVAPDKEASLILNDTERLSCDDEVITFVNRNLEPYRGYHTFMRALPALLQRRPRARVLIVGGDQLSYGAPAPAGLSWKSIYINEVRAQISDEDWKRVHFLGVLPYSHFLPLLQLSTVHVYLTYPFVLSWSLIEAMSASCAIVASDTAPVREVIEHDETGRLVDFFNARQLADEVCSLLDDPVARDRLGRNARSKARERYDLKTVCLPQQLAWVDQLAGGEYGQ